MFGQPVGSRGYLDWFTRQTGRFRVALHVGCRLRFRLMTQSWHKYVLVFVTVMTPAVFYFLHGYLRLDERIVNYLFGVRLEISTKCLGVIIVLIPILVFLFLRESMDQKPVEFRIEKGQYIFEIEDRQYHDDFLEINGLKLAVDFDADKAPDKSSESTRKKRPKKRRKEGN
jgi:hypothetical protein